MSIECSLRTEYNKLCICIGDQKHKDRITLLQNVLSTINNCILLFCEECLLTYNTPEYLTHKTIEWLNQTIDAKYIFPLYIYVNSICVNKDDDELVLPLLSPLQFALEKQVKSFNPIYVGVDGKITKKNNYRL